MFTANPREHLIVGDPSRRCWSCAAWIDANLPAGTQPLGDCTLVRWMLAGHRQMTHADDVCAKHEAAFGRDERAVAAGLG